MPQGPWNGASGRSGGGTAVGGIFAASSFDEHIAIVFIDIAIIMVVARLAGALFRRLRQPAVVGEIIAGIALGPTLLGLFPGDLHTEIFPPGEVREYLAVIAQLGLIIFMFIVGLELDAKLIKGKERVAGVISICSVALPFALGIGAAALIHDSHDGPANAGDFWTFALFLGASMSVTAFPVLARILTERKMHRTAVGALALASAAVDDILAWSLLAVVLAKVGSSDSRSLPEILLWSIAFLAVMFLVVRPLLRRLVPAHERAGRLTPELLSVVMVGVLTCAYATSWIGIHSIFGAFVFGAVMPREGAHHLTEEILERLEQLTVLVLLPVFFIATGLQVDVSDLSAGQLPELGLLLLVACAGKFLGAVIGARSQKVPMRRAAALGVLMNTRGLTELVILNIGFSALVLDQSLFTMLVVMAVITTVITEPLLRLVYSDRHLARDIAAAERSELGGPGTHRVLVLVEPDAPDRTRALVDVATRLATRSGPSEVVLSQLRPLHAGSTQLGTGLGLELELMAASMAETSALSDVVTARGLRCVVLDQLSDDLVADLVAQAARIGADVVVVADGAPEWVDQIDGAGLEATLVVVGDRWDREPTGVRLLLAGGDDDGAAAVVALDLVRRRTVPLEASASGRRAERMAATARGRARRWGVAVGDPGACPVVVAGLDNGGSTPADLRVSAPPLGGADALERYFDEQGTEPAAVEPAAGAGPAR